MSSPRDGRPEPDVARAVTEYAVLCRDALPDDVHVRSFAGIWLLLAGLAPAVAGLRGRADLEVALGMPVADAQRLARRLLGEQREDLAVAVAGWLREDVVLRGPLPVRLDPLPDQARLDRWAQEATRGLVPSFPVTLHPDTVLVLASALAARTAWREPLDAIDGDRLLVREDGLVAVVETRAAGLVAVASPPGRGDLDVVSVVAAPEVPQRQVWAAVDEVAGWVLDSSILPRRVPAAELDPSGHAWQVRRQSWSVPEGSTAAEVWRAVVPGWSLDSTTDLTDAPGVAEVTGAVLDLVPREPRWAEATQAATAAYGAEGFAAAAVTAIAFMAGSALPPPTKVRLVDLRFDRPHAVVALARGGAWEGVPIVHAWVDGTSDPAFTPRWEL